MTDNPHTIYGYVTSNKQPLSNVTITIVNKDDTNSISSQTNQDGKYQMDVTNVLSEGEIAYIEATNITYIFKANSYGIPKRIDIDLTGVIPTDTSNVEVNVDVL